MFNIEPETLFRIVDIAAVVANGLLGGAVARALRFDMVGFLLLAVVCSMGGGMIRDILLNVGLPIALTDGWYWVGAITSAALAYVLDLSSNWAWAVGRLPAPSNPLPWDCTGFQQSRWG